MDKYSLTEDDLNKKKSKKSKDDDDEEETKPAKSKGKKGKDRSEEKSGEKAGRKGKKDEEKEDKKDNKKNDKKNDTKKDDDKKGDKKGKSKGKNWLRRLNFMQLKYKLMTSLLTEWNGYNYSYVMDPTDAGKAKRNTLQLYATLEKYDMYKRKVAVTPQLYDHDLLCYNDSV